MVPPEPNDYSWVAKLRAKWTEHIISARLVQAVLFFAMVIGAPIACYKYWQDLITFSCELAPSWLERCPKKGNPGDPPPPTPEPPDQDNSLVDPPPKCDNACELERIYAHLNEWEKTRRGSRSEAQEREQDGKYIETVPIDNTHGFDCPRAALYGQHDARLQVLGDELQVTKFAHYSDSMGMGGRQVSSCTAKRTQLENYSFVTKVPGPRCEAILSNGNKVANVVAIDLSCKKNAGECWVCDRDSPALADTSQKFLLGFAEEKLWFAWARAFARWNSSTNSDREYCLNQTDWPNSPQCLGIPAWHAMEIRRLEAERFRGQAGN